MPLVQDRFHTCRAYASRAGAVSIIFEPSTSQILVARFELEPTIFSASWARAAQSSARLGSITALEATLWFIAVLMAIWWWEGKLNRKIECVALLVLRLIVLNCGTCNCLYLNRFPASFSCRHRCILLHHSEWTSSQKVWSKTTWHGTLLQGLLLLGRYWKAMGVLSVSYPHGEQMPPLEWVGPALNFGFPLLWLHLILMTLVRRFNESVKFSLHWTVRLICNVRILKE